MSDNGSEFLAKKVQEWIETEGSSLMAKQNP